MTIWRGDYRSYSAPGALAEAAHKTGRSKANFELREISKKEYEQLVQQIRADGVLRQASKLDHSAEETVIDETSNLRSRVYFKALASATRENLASAIHSSLVKRSPSQGRCIGPAKFACTIGMDSIIIQDQTQDQKRSFSCIWRHICWNNSDRFG